MKYNLLLSILKVIAHLPLSVLYIISDIVCFILHNVVRYRRKVVRDNLASSFPDKSEKELRNIERKFYKNFTDNFVETVKLLHISDDEMKKRMEFVGTEIIDRLLSENRNITVYFAHVFNWEWATSISLHTERKPSDDMVFAQVYRPLRNATFDRLMLLVRSRFQSKGLPKATTLRHLIKYRAANVQTITGFMSDQHPSHGDDGIITTLLNHPTLMISGTEIIARRLNTAVIYWDMEHPRRGHYRITTHLITDNPTTTETGQITLEYTRLLQSTIERDPSIWLWSHKRWKHPVNTQQ